MESQASSGNIIQELFGVAGKRVLVTGASRGIGQAIAEGFVKAGARVYICSRDAAKCEATAEELRRFGHCTALPCDIASAEQRRQMVARLREHESALDVLVNNAGALWAAPLAEYPESGWDKVFDLNVKGCFFITKELVPLLEAAGTHEDPARIINIGSIDAFHTPSHETYAYPASKAALHHLTRHLARLLAPRHITANIIAPGQFPSKMLAGTLEKKGLDTLLEPIPLKRLTAPSDMAGAAIYLASRAGAYLTAAMVPVDGGLATTL
ncbi:SDR family oxidoreductase [Pseudorhodoferax sp.]|uniref:SDR family oxidoreductase n=1 Tax=Pseudorhodoferax sp. TaxID=1993553 RepID=UPI0039E6255F